MNIQHYIEKLHNSESFKEFQKLNPKSFLCGGFFIIDLKEEKNEQKHLDYYNPEKKEMSSFCLNNNCEIKPIDTLNKDYTPLKIKDTLDFSFEDIQNLILDKIKEEKIDKKTEKILASLQCVEDKHYLIGTIFISGLGLIKFRFNLETKEFEDFEKKSFMDIIRKR